MAAAAPAGSPSIARVWRSIKFQLPVASTPLLVVGMAIVALVISLLQTVAPFIGPALIVGTLAIPLLFLFSPESLLLMAIAVGLYGRLLTPFGAPAYLTYGHFFLALIAILRLLSTKGLTRELSFLCLGLVLLLVAILVSSVINGFSAPLLPILLWLDLAEPFIFMGLLYNASAFGRRILLYGLVVMALSQIPSVAVQYLQYGYGDNVKGTIIDSGSGHHVMGALALTGMVAATFMGWHGKNRLFWFTVALVLFPLPVLSDAKQVIAVFVAAFIPLYFLRYRASPLTIVAVISGVLLIALGSVLDPEFTQLTNSAILNKNVTLKEQKLVETLSYIDAEHRIFGLGPGNGLSKVSMLTVPMYGFRVPSALVGTQPSKLGLLAFEKVGLKDSSTNSDLASWTGVYSDIGFFGLLAYLGLWIWALSLVFRMQSDGRLIATGALLVVLLFGVVAVWLEEPVFTLSIAALLVGLPLASGRRASVLLHNRGSDAPDVVPNEGDRTALVTSPAGSRTSTIAVMPSTNGHPWRS